MSEGVFFIVTGATEGNFIHLVPCVLVEDMADGLVFVPEKFPCPCYVVIKGYCVMAFKVFSALTFNTHGRLVPDYPFIVDERAAYSVFHLFKNIVSHGVEYTLRVWGFTSTKDGIYRHFCFKKGESCKVLEVKVVMCRGKKGNGESEKCPMSILRKL